jgi:sigma-B regulation protein RsbU (phosphoserine phosphatase)
MWDIHSTTELVKNMSTAGEPDDLLRRFIEHVRRRVHVDRALVLSSAALTAPQYRIVRSVKWDAGWGSVLAESAEVREGGLLAKLLYTGSFQNIADLSPEAFDPALDLLRGSRSLIAFPLFEKGAGTGMVVMLGPSPHTCSTTDLCSLAMMSALLDRAIHAQTLARQLESTCRELDSELQAAADVQRWLLPSLPRLDDIGIAASYRTARYSSGDYYDVGRLPDGKLGVLIADVSGKGAPAAVLMAVLRSIVHDEVDRARPTGPAALLDYADARLRAMGLPQRCAFVTAFCGTLDVATGVLIYSCAGHNPPRLLRMRDRTIFALDGAKSLPLGLLDEPSTHAEETVLLMPGDLALFYTDGITEARSPSGEFFGEDCLDQILRELPGVVTPDAVVHAITKEIARFEGDGTPADDQTVLALSRFARHA